MQSIPVRITQRCCQSRGFTMINKGFNQKSCITVKVNDMQRDSLNLPQIVMAGNL